MKFAFEDQKINFFSYGEEKEVTLLKEAYINNKRIAIVGIEDEEPYGVLSVNLADAELAENEVAIKTWGENELWAKSALQSGFFLDTGKRIPTGWCEASVWIMVEKEGL